MRLEHRFVLAEYLSEWFQFHKGAIRTVRSICSAAPLLCFNSIKVRLEPKQEVEDQVNHIRFNSIKVRLEPCSVRRAKAAVLSFNSIKVRLEQFIRSLSVIDEYVSIP